MNPYFSFSNIMYWAEGMWGILTVVFWSITYILIAVAGFYSRKNKKVSMPYIAGVLNAAWEIAATIYTEGNPGFIIWFIVDLIIIFWGLSFLPSAKKRLLYCFSLVSFTGLHLYCFAHYRPAFLFTVYLIDSIMAFEFICKRTSLSSKFQIPIAVAKLLGDLFAGLTFLNEYWFVFWFAAISFICNLVYLILCIKFRSHRKQLNE